MDGLRVTPLRTRGRPPGALRARRPHPRPVPVIHPPRVSVTVHADRVRVELAGDVDVSVPQLQPAVATAGGPRLPVDVDCSRVTFMDSSGAQFLAHLVTTVHPHRVHVLDPPRRVHDLLERMALDTVLDLDAPL